MGQFGAHSEHAASSQHGEVRGLFGLNDELEQSALGKACEVCLAGSQGHRVEAVTEGVFLGDRVSNEESHFEKSPAHTRNLAFIPTCFHCNVADAEATLFEDFFRAQKFQYIEVSDQPRSV